MALAKIAAKGAVATVLWQAVRICIQVISVVALARLLDPTQIGLVSMVVAITGVGEILRDFGLALGAVQAKMLSQAEKSNLFWINTSLGLAISSVFWVSAWPIAWLYAEPKLVFITQTMCITFTINGFATQYQAELHRDMRLGRMGLAEVGGQAAGLIAGILVAVSTPTYAAIVTQQIVQTVVVATLLVALARWRPSWPDRSVSVRHIARFGAAVSGTQVIAYLSKNIDNIAVGYRWGAYELGLYGRAFQLVTLPLQQLTAPISRVAIPLFSRALDDNRKYSAYLLVCQTIIVGLAASIFGLLAGVSVPFVNILLGEKWLAIAPMLQVLCLGGVFKILGQVPYWIFISHGSTTRQLKLYLVGQPMIISCIIIGSQWGGIGVAWGGAIGYIAFWLMQMYTVRSVTAVPIGPIFKNGLLVACLAGGPAWTIGWLATRLFENSWVICFFSGIVLTIYLALLILLFPHQRIRLLQIAKLVRDKN